MPVIRMIIIRAVSSTSIGGLSLDQGGPCAFALPSPDPVQEHARLYPVQHLPSLIDLSALEEHERLL